MTGPVQVLVLGFDRPVVTGEVLAELGRLRDAGVVRLLDVLVASRGSDGSFETLDIKANEAGFSGRIVTEILGEPDPLTRTQVIDVTGMPSWSLSDSVPDGTTVVIGLIEHLWARDLAAAVAGAGGRPLEETWLAPDDRARVEKLLGVAESRPG